MRIRLTVALFTLVLAFFAGCTPKVDTTPGTGTAVKEGDVKKLDTPPQPPPPPKT